MSFLQEALKAMEPGCSEASRNLELGVVAQISIAISLKRVADALDRVTTPAGVEKLVTDLRPVFERMDK